MKDWDDREKELEEQDKNSSNIKNKEWEMMKAKVQRLEVNLDIILGKLADAELEIKHLKGDPSFSLDSSLL